MSSKSLPQSDWTAQKLAKPLSDTASAEDDQCLLAMGSGCVYPSENSSTTPMDNGSSQEMHYFSPTDIPSLPSFTVPSSPGYLQQPVFTAYPHAYCGVAFGPAIHNWPANHLTLSPGHAIYGSGDLVSSQGSIMSARMNYPYGSPQVFYDMNIGNFGSMQTSLTCWKPTKRSTTNSKVHRPGSRYGPNPDYRVKSAVQNYNYLADSPESYQCQDVPSTSDTSTVLRKCSNEQEGTQSDQHRNSFRAATVLQPKSALNNARFEVTPDILVKLSNGCPIPTPVPSLFAALSFEEALESSLYNPNNTTNVYIRGLPPDTTDEMLLEICARFGKVVSSKAILEAQTNSCKGFGFACFEKEADATACIAGLIHCGYQVSFAKESFSTRLKNLQDPQSTNLYLSNLPLNVHEKDLEELFHPQKVVSNRILRDANNLSRGVGFARMSDRESAEEVISRFDGLAIDGDPGGLPLQVRFADSPSQKRLKGQTQRRRQWRAREYNMLTGRAHLQDGTLLQIPTLPGGEGLMIMNPMQGTPTGGTFASSLHHYPGPPQLLDVPQIKAQALGSCQPRTLHDVHHLQTSEARAELVEGIANAALKKLST